MLGLEGVLLGIGGFLSKVSLACRPWIVFEAAYLRGMIDFEGRLAGGVKVSSVAERVVLAYHNLLSISHTDLLIASRSILTSSLPPGNFTVVYCASLYFLKAGPRDDTSLLAKALMSDVVSVSYTVNQVHTAYRLQRSRAIEVSVGCFNRIDYSYQPLRAVQIRRTMLPFVVWTPWL